MEETKHIVGYRRKNRRDEVVIYVRGNNEAMQEIMCKLYAVNNDYRVLYVTRNLDDVKNCDILLVANLSRISRNRMEYEKIVKELKKRDIEVESVAKGEDIYNIFSAKDIYKSLDTLEVKWK